MLSIGQSNVLKGALLSFILGVLPGCGPRDSRSVNVPLASSKMPVVAVQCREINNGNHSPFRELKTTRQLDDCYVYEMTLENNTQQVVSVSRQNVMCPTFSPQEFLSILGQELGKELESVADNDIGLKLSASIKDLVRQYGDQIKQCGDFFREMLLRMFLDKECVIEPGNKKVVLIIAHGQQPQINLNLNFLDTVSSTSVCIGMKK